MIHAHTTTHSQMGGGREERYHGKAGKQCRCPAGSLQLGPAQVELPPGERLQGVLVQTHRVAPCSSRSQSQAERAEMTSLARTHVQQHRRPRGPFSERTLTRRCGQLAQLRKPPRVFLLVSHPPPASLAECVERVVLPPSLHLTLPIMPCAAEKKKKPLSSARRRHVCFLVSFLMLTNESQPKAKKTKRGETLRA